MILLWKAFTARGGPRRWWRKQSVPWGKFFVMGFLDALSAFLSTMGGAFTDGSLQNLLNQCVIPATIRFTSPSTTRTFRRSSARAAEPSAFANPSLANRTLYQAISESNGYTMMAFGSLVSLEMLTICWPLGSPPICS